MSRLSDLLRQVASKDSQLAADLKREFEALNKRRAFGLNFERHVPETVELPGRQIRRGDKVRFLPERGKSPGSVDRRLWRVKAIRRTDDGKMAQLVRQDDPDSEPEATNRIIDDLVVVAEFRDPIYPGLVSTGKAERGGDKPFHTVINAENFHALQALLYTCEGKVDAIYIDPPYNTRDKDWKYNNDYVDSDDAYRHSKWLAMMERRLKFARRLLNPAGSVLIVTIDDNENARLSLLLEQVFPDGAITSVSAVINPKGTPENGFGRVDENVIFVGIGDTEACKVLDSMHGDRPKQTSVRVRWRGLTRTGANGIRAKSPGAYFPIFIRIDDGSIHSSGNVPPPDSDGLDVVPPEGTVAVWPTPRPDGTLGRWSVVKSKFDQLLAIGAVKTGKIDVETGVFPLWYLTDPNLKSIDVGDIVVTGRQPDGAMIVEYADANTKKTSPKTVWSRPAHSASEYGSGLLSQLVPGRTFPYPKSLYAVEDTLRTYVGDKRDALVVDFFAGSGTTTHAVLRLNQQDDGRRQSIAVTNNEISADEEKRLRSQGLRPGDPEWEKLGICEYITKPRITAAITGKTPEGEPLKGDYKFTDEFPMAEGFAENVEFFTMTYEALRPVAHHRSFEAIAPLLWLKAGAQGRRIEKATDDFDIADNYGILFDLDKSHDFIAAIVKVDEVRMVFVVTDDDRAYQAVCAELPANITPVRLYESYLTSFAINTGKE